MHLSRLPLCGLILGMSFIAPSSGRAGTDASFVESLSSEEQAETGIQRLSLEQRDALDQQIARELALARQGDVIAFARTFTTRRPASEFEASGLATLTPPEAEKLDAAVARALAARPVAMIPRERTPVAAIETVRHRPQWHGVISATYGRSSGGGEFYGGSVTSIYEDPDRGFAAALTLDRYQGDGLFFGHGRHCRYGRGTRHPWHR